MPPIPKFAKALAKLTKANPKLVSEETLPKILKKECFGKRYGKANTRYY